MYYVYICAYAWCRAVLSKCSCHINWIKEVATLSLSSRNAVGQPITVLSSFRSRTPPRPTLAALCSPCLTPTGVRRPSHPDGKAHFHPWSAAMNRGVCPVWHGVKHHFNDTPPPLPARCPSTLCPASWRDTCSARLSQQPLKSCPVQPDCFMKVSADQ